MTEAPKPQSWWQTLPGLLTAFAGIITAVTGLFAALYQGGIIGHKDDAQRAKDESRPAAAAVSRAPDAAKPPDPATPGAPVQSQSKPWPEAQAVLSTRDGSSTTLRAETLSNCISVNPYLALASGQEIAFEQMRSFEVLQADPSGAPNAKATVQITLLDGRTLDGRVEANCDLFGFNELGRYATTFQRLKRVDFRR